MERPLFFKLNPRVESQTFALRPEGFRVGDMVRLDIVGDFRPTSNSDAGNYRDAYQNTVFRLGGETVRANPDTLKAERATLVAINRDPSPLDNADPDNDYGVIAKLVPFSGGDDVFRFTGRARIPDTFGSLYNAKGGDDLVVMPNVPLAGFVNSRTFRAGDGDDTVRAGGLDLRLDFGAGVDRFELDSARVPCASARTATATRRW